MAKIRKEKLKRINLISKGLSVKDIGWKKILATLGFKYFYTMFKSFILLLVILITNPTITFSQNFTEKIFGPGTGKQIHQLPNGSYVFCGSRVNGTTNTGFIYKTDPSGTLIDSIFFPDCNVNALIVEPDGYIVATDSAEQGEIFKSNFSGNISWKNRYRIAEWRSWSWSILQRPDGKLFGFIAGDGETSSNPNLTTLFDTSGITTSTTVIENNGALYYHPSVMALTPDDGVITAQIAGASGDFSRLTKVSSSNTVQWSKTIYDTINGSPYITYSVTVNPTSYIFAGSVNDNNLSAYYPLLYITDLNGNVILERKYESELLNYEFSKVIKTANGFIAVANRLYDQVSILLLDQVGDIMWRHDFNRPRYTLVEDVTLSNSGYPLIIGTTNDSLNQQRVYVINTDSLFTNSGSAGVVVFTKSDSLICAGDSIHFINLSQGVPQSYLWEFPGGNPSQSTDFNPSVVYNTPGIYSVKLTGTFINNTDSILLDSIITVLPVPTINISGNLQVCSGDSTTLSVDSTFGSVIWSNNDTTFTTMISAGNYSVTVSNNVCSRTTAFTVNGILIDVSVTTGDSILTANATNATFQWMNCNGSILQNDTSAELRANDPALFQVIVTQNGCTDTSQCYNILNTGINSNKKQLLEFYPNPASDYITIRSSEMIDKSFTFYIYDITGKQIMKKENIKINSSLSLKEIPNGLFRITIDSEQYQQTQFLIIARDY